MSQIFIIAEAGVNHNGSLERAIQMIDVAKASGADAIKFQTFSANRLVTKNTEKADYQKKHTARDESSQQMLKKLELNGEAHEQLLECCAEKNILFMSSPFDLDSVALLADLGCPIIKIGSGEITNLPLLEAIGELKREVILSTGMSNLEEIGAALHVLQNSGTIKERITLLHATTEYPAPFEEVNLRAMQSIGNQFQINVGYSDHTPGIEIPVAAATLGATVIEKHFTLDRTLPGPDHKASLEPDELKKMVEQIRHVESALGDGIKKPTTSEIRNIPFARKSIVASCPIHKGDIFHSHNLTTKRPGTGLSPMKWYEIIGQPAPRSFEMDECIPENILLAAFNEDTL